VTLWCRPTGSGPRARSVRPYHELMITGVHAIVFGADAEAARAFFADVLGWPSADAGDGWLIFALPPAELAVHPADESGRHELYLMCDDITATRQQLESRGVEFTEPVADQGWGLLTRLRIPGGGEIGLYEPRHASPLAAAGASDS
jgi:predicted enzyme related to lactoylglutathione lyase